MTTPRFAFLGSPAFAATVLNGLLAAGWKPILVVTEPPKPTGRTHALTPTAVQTFAATQNLPIATPATKAELTQVLRDADPDLLVVAAYGRLLPSELLTLGRFGAVNVHASLLPAYRGASPIQAAILAGDPTTGITFMQMEPTLDTGPMLSTVTVPITPRDTTTTLAQSLAGEAAKTLPSVLQAYVAGTLTGTAQVDADASYAPKLGSNDGQITLSKIDAQTLDRKVRALNPWPGVFTEEFGERLKIRNGYLSGDTYVITELQWAGKRPTDAATFARAYPSILTSLPKSTKLEASFPEPQDPVSAGH